jgi:hypothetical protein
MALGRAELLGVRYTKDGAGLGKIFVSYIFGFSEDITCYFFRVE